MNDCECCEGTEVLTPEEIANRPGLDALAYRVGTHSTFLESMLARLSSAGYPALHDLTTREGADPAIALLDAWATVAHVLTFYQERIANEGYLRTAVERRSLVELARLVGYRPRPGVASSVFLAFTLDDNYEVVIPAGTRAQSLPAPGELPQPFETSAKLSADANWNMLQPRLLRPQAITLDPNNPIPGTDATRIKVLYFEGTATRLQPNDPILFVFGTGAGQQAMRRVKSVDEQFAEKRTRVELQAIVPGDGDQAVLPGAVLGEDDRCACPAPAARALALAAPDGAQPAMSLAAGTPRLETGLVQRLLKPASIPPASPERLVRNADALYAPGSDLGPQILLAVHPELEGKLYTALRNANVTPPAPLQATEALRVKAAPFGDTAPLRPVLDEQGALSGFEEWPLTDQVSLGIRLALPTREGGLLSCLTEDVVLAASTRNQITLFARRSGRTQTRTVPLASKQVMLGDVPVDIRVAPPAGPRVRVVHNLDIPALDILVDGQPALTDMPVGTVMDLDATAGSHRITATVAGEPDHRLAEGEVRWQAGQDYLVVVRRDGTINNLIEDTEPVSLDHAVVNFVHASLEEAAFTILRDESLPETGRELIDGLKPGEAESQPLAPRRHVLTVRRTGDENSPEAQIEVELEGGEHYTVVLIGRLDAEPRLAAVQFRAEARECGRLAVEFLPFQRELRLVQRTDGLVVEVEDKGLDSVRSWQLQMQGETVDEEAGGERVIINTAKGIAVRADVLLAPPQPRVLALNGQFDRIVPGSWVVVDRPEGQDPIARRQIIARVQSVETVSRSDYGLSASVTQLVLDRDWLTVADRLLTVVRRTAIYAQGEALDLGDEPVEEPVSGDSIELDDLYGGLEPGRWLIVAGERTDLCTTTGVRATELVMLSSVKQDVGQVSLGTAEDGTPLVADRPGDRAHSFIKLASPLSYCYKRDTVTIYGNVVKATHGETHTEALGSGDASKRLQQFALRNLPLTYLSAPTPAGAASTLTVRVNSVRWREADNLTELSPDDRGYLIRTDDDGKTVVIFGDGRHGARVPTGAENVTALYRSGIGSPGNVGASQISLLATRPLGVKGVINPMRATGGADAENGDQIRRNAPLAVLALDRLVSVEDYADFARTFAGIGKADAVRLADGHRQLVHVTIAGAGNVPVDKSSDLYRNLFAALQRYGDPGLPLRLDVYEPMLVVIKACVRIDPDYSWDSVSGEIRDKLDKALGFEKRELGQDVTSDEILAVIQAVAGVEYVDLDILDGINRARLAAFQSVGGGPALPEALDLTLKHRLTPELARRDPDNPGAILAAELAYLDSSIDDTLLLEELPQ